MIDTVLYMYVLLLFALNVERKGPQDQSSAGTLSGTCTLIEI